MGRNQLLPMKSEHSSNRKLPEHKWTQCYCNWILICFCIVTIFPCGFFIFCYSLCWIGIISGILKLKESDAISLAYFIQKPVGGCIGPGNKCSNGFKKKIGPMEISQNTRQKLFLFSDFLIGLHAKNTHTQSKKKCFRECLKSLNSVVYCFPNMEVRCWRGISVRSKSVFQRHQKFLWCRKKDDEYPFEHVIANCTSKTSPLLFTMQALLSLFWGDFIGLSNKTLDSFRDSLWSSEVSLWLPIPYKVRTAALSPLSDFHSTDINSL